MFGTTGNHVTDCGCQPGSESEYSLARCPGCFTYTLIHDDKPVCDWCMEAQEPVEPGEREAA